MRGRSSWKPHKCEISPSCPPWRSLLITFLNGAAACTSCPVGAQAGGAHLGEGDRLGKRWRRAWERSPHIDSLSHTHAYTNTHLVTQETPMCTHHVRHRDGIKTNPVCALAELMGRGRRQMGIEITHKEIITVCEGDTNIAGQLGHKFVRIGCVFLPP